MATSELTSNAGPASSGKSRIFKNFINGEWVESTTGETFENLNPADTRDVVGIFQKSGKEDVNAAVDAAKQAYAKWSLVPAPRRAEIVYAASRDPDRAQRRVLARHDSRDGQGPQGDSRRYPGSHRHRLLHGRRRPPHVRAYHARELPNKFAMCVRQPIGVCGMITPWNFPMAIPSWKLFPAIIAGNTCVIKPAQDTPLSTFNFVKALSRCRAAEGRGQHRDRIRRAKWARR